MIRGYIPRGRKGIKKLSRLFENLHSFICAKVTSNALLKR
jgi:hypothetical protein